MTITAHGKIHGNTIQLDSELGLPEGQEVLVTVVVSSSKPAWGEGIKRSAGIASNITGFHEAFEQVAQDRKATEFRDAAP